MRLLPFIIGLALSAAAFAGDKGNLRSFTNAPSGYGQGDSVVCRGNDNRIKSAFILEYAELDMLKSSLIKYDSSLTDYEYIDRLGYFLEKEAPDLFNGFRNVGLRIAAQGQNFLNNNNQPDMGVSFLSNQPYLEANFAKASKAPKNMAKDCQIESLVSAQKTYRGMQFLIQADIYVKLSKRDRRGVVLHEALFNSLQRYYGDLDSARTRYIHQRLVQYDLTELTPEVMQDILSHSYLDFIRPQ